MRATTAILSALVFSPAGLHAGAKLPAVNVAYHPNLHGAGVVAIGHARGLFEEAGIEVRAVRFTSGPPEIQALLAGDIDIGFIGTGALPVIMDGRAVVVAIDLVGLAEEVLARPGSGVESVADLRGKKVITSFATSGEMILHVALAEAGVPAKDVDIINASPENAVAAFSAGETDAIALWQPLTHRVRKAVPEARLIASGKGFYPDWTFPIVWIANRDFAASRPDLVKRFLAAARKAIDYRAENLDETVELVSEYAEVPLEDIAAQKDSAKFLTSDELDRVLRDGSAERWFRRLGTLFADMGRLEDPAEPSTYLLKDLFLEAPLETASGGPAEARATRRFGPVSILAGAAALMALGGLLVYWRHRSS